ncbi:MAG TPA: hypothetical protein VNK67_05195 [Burkholderiales bacterium]|nr:hypothetical protein [Burkholderiales bacterium]
MPPTGIVQRDAVLLGSPAAEFHALLLEHGPFRRFVFGLYSARLAEAMEWVEGGRVSPARRATRPAAALLRDAAPGAARAQPITALDPRALAALACG